MNINGDSELTIFQGGPSIHLDTSGQRLEEEEELQDQQRRNAELQKELENAFDDLIDDEDENDITQNSTQYNSRLSPGNQDNVLRHNKPPQNVFNGHLQQPILQQLNQQFTSQDFPLRDEVTKLKHQVESKTRELEYVTCELNNERRKNKSQGDEYDKRLAIAEAEKERALMTRGQTHELLVENKSKMLEMEDVCDNLRSKIKSLENKNSELVAEVENTNLLLSDVQHKYSMVEKNALYNADRNADLILKQAQERHSAQIAMMQQQIDSLKSKLDNSEHEYKNLDIRYKELQRSRECLLIEKSETINQLNHNLEEAQRQCQGFLSKPNMTQENRRLQNMVNTLELQTDEMAKTINNLTQKLQTTTSELEMMDSIVCESGGNNVSFSESNFLQRNLQTNSSGSSSTPINQDDRLKRLKDELFKSINNIKIKREEIKILEKQLNEKNSEIKILKNDENKALVDLNHYKDESCKLQSKLNMLETELERVRKVKRNSLEHEKKDQEKQDEQICTLEMKNEELSLNLKKLEGDFQELNLKYKQTLEDQQVKQNLSENNNKDHKLIVEQLNQEIKQLKEVSIDLDAERNKVALIESALKMNEIKCEELVKMLEREKEEKQRRLSDIRGKLYGSSLNEDKSSKNASNQCTKCNEYLTEITKYEIKCLQLNNVNADYFKELTQLKIDLQDAQVTVDHLSEKLNLKVSRDEEINKLKVKALEFEEYMRSQPRSGSLGSSSKSSPPSSINTNNSTLKTDVSTSTTPTSSKKELRDQCCSTSPDLDDKKDKKRHHSESKLRDEMAKIFAAEIKSMERKYREENEKIENAVQLLREELEMKSKELHIRSQEVELLKFTILKEREKMEETRGEFKTRVEQQNETIKKYRSEFENSQQKIRSLVKELSEKGASVDTERQAVNDMIKQINEERKSLSKREDDVGKKLRMLDEENNKVIEQLREKYLSAKKTAQNYKQYSEDKEAHMLKEYERIKEGYTEALTKVQNRMRDVLDSQEKIVKDRIRKIETDCDLKVEILKNELFKHKQGI